MNFKKMLASIGLLAIAVPTSLSVVSCGSDAPTAKISLDTVIKITEVASDATETTIIDKVLALNPDSKVNKTDLEVNSFVAAQPGTKGSAKIAAKKESTFTGEVNITIKAADKINLDTVIKNKEVDGNTSNNETKVLQTIETANPEVKGNIQIKNFKAATQIANGSATVFAKENTKFTGEVNISIKSLNKTQLSSVIKITEVASDATETTIIDKVLALNPDSKVNKTDLEVNSFVAAQPGTKGSAKIAAKKESTFTGEVNITIKAADKINLDTVIKNKEVDGNTSNNETKVLQTIETANPEVKGNIQIKNFKAATQIANGSATVFAKENTKFTGEVNISIKSLNKTQLSSVIKITEVASDATETTIIDKVLALNPDSKVNKTDLEVNSFVAAQPGTKGSAKIAAKKESTFTGEVNITIKAADKINLDTVIKNKEVEGDLYNDETWVLNQIIFLNNDVTIEDVEIKEFKAATISQSGSAKITAIPESNFTGEVSITITKLTATKKGLNRIIINRVIDSNTNNTEQSVLNEVQKQHSELNSANISIKDFKAATKENFGSATIITKPNKTIEGEVAIVISKIDPAYNNIIENLKNAETKSAAKKDAWIAFFDYKEKQFIEIYGNGLLIADLDGTTDENVWRFIFWVLAHQRQELINQDIEMDYKDLDKIVSNSKNVWDKDQETVLHSGTYTVVFWDNSTHVIQLKDFKMFYELNKQ
ncbi:hypothetical protein [Spiroplasma platyhelix]|uniref:Lipoprotein n=1 Tax=Spiroplasma platyhelix PALS-1 TaxID=1276218 RepID=A0A846U0Y5_9MOLU|nr:hypothetical protein [Spiroplasma platyhelix]MBE4703806.1 hypothetical protein [Spiroplasma platyhelix PALS-1]NKE38179.1 hypothetical protein [Spiroplasma platyhelix PALS-1]